MIHNRALILAVALIAGQASWYSSQDACGPKTNPHPGCPTASGVSIYKLEAGPEYFIASNDFPLRSKVKVSANGKTITARVMDRGGFEKYGRVADLSRASFKALAGSTDNGLINVTIERIQ